MLYTPKTFVLRFGQKPWVFDFGGWAFAAQDVNHFTSRVSLAIRVGFVGVGGGVACDDDVG